MPEGSVELHTHSTFSDGVLTPTELVSLASDKGVSLLSLTDHDSVAGLPEAHTAARDHGIAFIDGVEVSASWRGQTIHIVGLDIDSGAEVLSKALARNLAARAERAEHITHRLSQAGISLPGLTGGHIPTRTHFARQLVAAGHAKDIKQAFKRFLSRGKPGWVPVEWLSLAGATKAIAAAGGIAVVAHPFRYKLTLSKLRVMLGEFVEAGGRGIEVVSGHTMPNQLKDMSRLATGLGLLASRGSDFHDPSQVWAPLGGGPSLPDDCTPVWNAFGGTEAELTTG